jgi:hypothetical protein
MSNVTDIILITAIDDCSSDGVANHYLLSKFLITNHKGSFLRQVDGIAGGDKNFHSDVFMAAVNYLEPEKFLSAFYAIKWDNPQRVQLLIRHEADNDFTVYTPK